MRPGSQLQGRHDNSEEQASVPWHGLCGNGMSGIFFFIDAAMFLCLGILGCFFKIDVCSLVV